MRLPRRARDRRSHAGAAWHDPRRRRATGLTRCARRSVTCRPFDLDRTLLRRSSALALAGSFREHGVIGRGQLAKAAAWQLLFAARGAGAETVRKAAEDGLMVLQGLPRRRAARPRRGRDGAGAEAARLPASRSTSSRAIASAASPSTSSRRRCRRSSRRSRASSASTARSDRSARSWTASTPAARSARATATARRRRSASSRAGGLRPRRLDRVLRQPHRPAVPRGGRPPGRRQPGPRAAPDRGRARLAGARVQRARLSGRAAGCGRRCSGSRSCSAPAPPSGPRAGVRPEERDRRALGFAEADDARRSPPTSTTPSGAASSGTGSRGSTGSRRCPTCSRMRGPQRVHAEPGFERWDGAGALGYLVARGDLRRQLAEPAGARARRRRVELLPDRARSATTCGGSPRAGSSPR